MRIALVAIFTASAVFARLPERAHLLVDFKTGRVLSHRAIDVITETPVNLGSLVKPFVVLAAAEGGLDFETFRVYCGETDVDAHPTNSCWFHPGHGEVGVTDAIAHSCNTYFLTLASYIDRRLLFDVYGRYGVLSDPQSASTNHSRYLTTGLGYACMGELDAVLFGMYALLTDGSLFRIDPSHTRIELNGQYPAPPHIRFAIREGMRTSSRIGTAKDTFAEAPLSVPPLIKTGTSAYSDGARKTPWRTHALTVLFAPADNPRYGVVVFVREGFGGAEGVQYAMSIIRPYVSERTGDSAP